MTDASGNSRTPELSEVIRSAIEYYLSDLYTMMPGKVDKYYPSEQRVDVKPTVKRRILTSNGDELLEDIPVIPDVPIMFPRTASFFLTFPIKQDDLVMLVFSQSSLDAWLSTSGKQDVDPNDFRMHDITDAVAIPGLYPFGSPIKDINSANVVLGKDNGGIQLHITESGTMEVKVNGESDEVVALGNALQSFWDTTVKNWVITHTHSTGVGPSGPPNEAASFPAFDTSILSTILKVKSG